MGHGLRVETRAQEVVGTGHHGGEIRPQDERPLELLGPDLAGLASPDRQVRVEEPSLLAGDPFGQAVGPAAVPAAAVGIVESLRRAVPERDEALESRPSSLRVRG